jgi:hypothetical protein
MRLSSAMMWGRSGGATRTARTRYNVQSRGKNVGVEKRQARSIRQRCWMEYSAGVGVIETPKRNLVQIMQRQKYVAISKGYAMTRP